MFERLLKWVASNDRAVKLFAATVGWILLLFACDWWFNGSRSADGLFYPDMGTTPKVQAWTAKLYSVLLVLGLPSAFLLWHWRDKNVRHQLEEQRKQVIEQSKQVENVRRDINLKEFQDVCLRAAGALDAKLDQAGRDTLQIAALHQLRSFLRGDYGDSFKRPTFELLGAGLAASAQKVGTQNVRKWLDSRKDGDPPIGDHVQTSVAKMRDTLDGVSKVRLSVIHDEWRAMFRAGYPLSNRNFDLLELPRGARLDRQDLQGSSFVGSELSGVHFEGANLSYANLEGTSLTQAHLESADLSRAHLEGASLFGAQLEGASLRSAFLQNANLRHARLEGASLRFANHEGADFCGAQFNGLTVLAKDWDQLTEPQRNAERQRPIDRGAINVDAPAPTVDPNSPDRIDD